MIRILAAKTVKTKKLSSNIWEKMRDSFMWLIYGKEFILRLEVAPLFWDFTMIFLERFIFSVFPND